MSKQTGEHWKFTVDCPQADAIYLVRDSVDGLSSWIEMKQNAEGLWEISLRLDKGGYRFRYYMAQDTTVFNCGDAGLTKERVHDADAAGQADLNLSADVITIA